MHPLFFTLTFPVIYVVRPYGKLWSLGWFQGGSLNIAGGFEIKLELVLVISHETNVVDFLAVVAEVC